MADEAPEAQPKKKATAKAKGAPKGKAKAGAKPKAKSNAKAKAKAKAGAKSKAKAKAKSKSGAKPKSTQDQKNEKKNAENQQALRTLMTDAKERRRNRQIFNLMKKCSLSLILLLARENSLFLSSMRSRYRSRRL